MFSSNNRILNLRRRSLLRFLLLPLLLLVFLATGAGQTQSVIPAPEYRARFATLVTTTPTLAPTPTPTPALRTLPSKPAGVAPPIHPAVATTQSTSCNPCFVFEPIEARQTPKDFSEIINKAEKVPAEVKVGLNTALHDYQKTPTMATAIGVLKFFSSGFYLMTTEQRAALFQADPALFLSVDIAKYEIVMHVRIGVGAKSSRRVGSSGLHEMKIMEWVAKHRPVNEMLDLLDENKQFFSDDDITNLTDLATLLADEDVNGSRATEKYREITRRWGNELDPKIVQTEFLSPTRAWRVIQEKHPGEIPKLPDYLYAWTASNPEKYNDPFGVFMLDVWGYDKGVFTKKVAEPTTSTVKFSEFYPKPDIPPASGKFAYIAGNYRQIYDVHHGAFKSQCKYLARMIHAWAFVHSGAGLPAGWQETLERAEAIYEKGENIQGAAEFQAQIKDVILNVVKTTHDYQMERVASELEKVYGELKDKPEGQLTAADFEKHPKLVEELNGLAIAYANVSEETHRELMKQFQERIQKGEASTQALEIFRSHVFKYIMEVVQDQANFERGNIEAFSTIRQDISKNLSEGLNAVDLDLFLEEVAKGKFTTRHLKLEGLRIVEEQTQVDPQTALRHAKLIRALSEGFFEGNKQYAIRVHEYFEKGPSTAVEMLQKLWRVFDSSSARSVSTSYVDEQGNRLSGEVVPTGLSLGIKVFGAAVKGAEWWGHVQNGAELYKNLHKWLYESGASSDLEIGQAQAALLINSVNFANLVGTLAGREHWKVPLSGALSSNTAGMLMGNAGGVGIDDRATDDLAYAALKDLLIMYQPHMASVILLVDLGRWGYKELKVGSEKNLMVQAMMENGVWEPANIKEMEDPIKYKEGVLPKLKGVRSEENGPVWEPVHIARYEFKAMKLSQSKVELDPRETLLDIAYAGSYIESDPIISTSIGALNEMSGSWAAKFFNQGKLPSNSREWNRDSIDRLGIIINHSDDDKSSPVLLSQVTLASSTPKDAGANSLRMMGYLMGDFWVKRQKILEEAVLPALIKEASRQWLAKLKADKLETGKANFLQEIKNIDSQVKEIDLKTWVRIGRVAFPSAYSPPEAAYNPDKDGTPIRDAFNSDSRVKTILEHLRKFQDILDKGVDPEPSYIPQGPGVMPRLRTLRNVLDEGKDEVKELRNLAFAWGDAYDKLHTVLDDAQNLVKEGKLELRPIYLRLTPGSWALSELTNAAGGDMATTKSWLNDYQLARKKVLEDIAKKAKETPLLSPISILGEEISTFLNSLVNNIDEKHTYSPAHPLWPKLLALRYQIQSIDTLQSFTGTMRPQEFRDVLVPMTIKGDAHVSPQDSDLQDPGARTDFLIKTREQMVAEYERLLETLKHQFDIEIAVNPDKPYIGQEANLISKAKLNPELPTPKLRPDGFPSYVSKFRWRLYDKRTGVEVVSGVETSEAKYTARISHEADYAIKVFALDGGGNVVARGDYDGPVAAPLLVWGNIGIGGGDYDGEPITINVGTLKQDDAKLGGFSLELNDYNEDVWKVAKGQATVVINGRTFYSNVSEVVADPNTGLIKLKEDLNILMPYKVSVKVSVTDKAKQLVNGATSEILNTGGAENDKPITIKADSATLKLATGDGVVAVAKYEPFGLSLFTQIVHFNPQEGRAIELKAELPMFDTGHLIASGRFVPDAAINPAPQLNGGQVTSNIGSAGVEDQGTFTLANDKPINLQSNPQFEATASVTDASGKRYFPKAGKITKGISGDSRLDLGSIEVGRLGLTLKPIQVELLDWTGRAITASAGRSQVLINGVAAANNGGAFVGEYTFTDDNEQILIEGNFDMPDGSQSVIQQHIAARDFGGIGAPSPQSTSYSLKLPIYLPGSLRVSGRTRIEGVPKDHSPPGFVALNDPKHGLADAPLSNMPFDFTYHLPVYLTENLTIQATANDGDINYHGSISAKAPSGAGTLDVGEIVLAIGGDKKEETASNEEPPEPVNSAGDPAKPTAGDDGPPEPVTSDHKPPAGQAGKDPSANEPPEPVAGNKPPGNGSGVDASGNEPPEPVAGNTIKPSGNQGSGNEAPEPVAGNRPPVNEAPESTGGGNRPSTSGNQGSPNPGDRTPGDSNTNEQKPESTGGDSAKKLDLSGLWNVIWQTRGDELLGDGTRTDRWEFTDLGGGKWLLKITILEVRKDSQGEISAEPPAQKRPMKPASW